nr:uncharacterized protein LOC122605143 isoform X2 [Erigeron canadensis]XP_043633961.1 uncharacterized protein LOC122605143 isoform X2 [Erigeron canadensis]
MIEPEQDDQWRAPKDLEKKLALRLAELNEEEKTHPKSHPLEEGPKNQKKERKGKETVVINELMFGGPFAEENSSKFVLRKKGYIIKDKLVIPPNPLPETFRFSEETLSRIVLRRSGYTFTDEMYQEKKLIQLLLVALCSYYTFSKLYMIFIYLGTIILKTLK